MEYLTKEEIEKALPVALEIYKGFFNELTTALKNSISNFEGAMWNACDAKYITYYQGKRDAFNEISKRLHKEYLLAESFAAYNPHIENNFKIARDKDVEKAYPICEEMRSRDRNKAMMHRRALAELLEHYFMEGMAVGNALAKGSNGEEFKPEDFESTCIKHLVHPDFQKEDNMTTC